METQKLPSAPSRISARDIERPLKACHRWRWRPSALALAAAFVPVWAGVSHAASPNSSITSTAGLDCLIQPSQTVQVGTASAGVIQTMRVERGDYVRRGQALVQLDSRVERAALAIAREKADALGEAQATRGASDLAQRELERAADLVKENFVSRTFYDRQRAEVEVASGRGQQAEEKRRLAEREVQLASAQLTQRTVLSPVDGVVVERHVSPGEYVEQKPVLRIAQIDPLRVDVLVPAAVFGQVNVGDKAQVTPELVNKQVRSATVTGVDRVIDAASHTFRVRLELANPGGKLPPGLRCKANLVAVIGQDGQDAKRLGRLDKSGSPSFGAAKPVDEQVQGVGVPTGSDAPARTVAFARGQRHEVPSPQMPLPKPAALAVAAVGSIAVKWATQTAYEAHTNDSSESTQTANLRPKLQLDLTAAELAFAESTPVQPKPAQTRPQSINPAPRLTVAAVR